MCRRKGVTRIEEGDPVDHVADGASAGDGFIDRNDRSEREAVDFGAVGGVVREEVAIPAIPGTHDVVAKIGGANVDVGVGV